MLSDEKQSKTDQYYAITRHNNIAISREQQSWRCSFSFIQTCLQFIFHEAETRSPRLLIKGYSNIVMSCDGISTD